MLCRRRLCPLLAIALSWLCILSARAQDVIGAQNIQQLRPAQRIDFAALPGEFELGWFAATDDASQFLIVDKSRQLHLLGAQGDIEPWQVVQPPGDLHSTVVDARFHAGEPMVLTWQAAGAYLNSTRLPRGIEPVALHSFEGQAVLEVRGQQGQQYFQAVEPGRAGGWRMSLRADLPALPGAGAAVRIGRIALPWLLLSSLQDSRLHVSYYGAGLLEPAMWDWHLPGGPAVAGAMNAPAGSHFAWVDASGERLNLLDIQTGNNKIVAALEGAYAQYMLLSADASSILAVHVDAQPVVVAWDSASGQRHLLGSYRSCRRIPDRIALSADGAALIIGCDSGLDIWRIEAS